VYVTGEELERDFAAPAMPYDGGLLLLRTNHPPALLRRVEEKRRFILQRRGRAGL
jgi:hypothetical protein